MKSRKIAIIAGVVVGLVAALAEPTVADANLTGLRIYTDTSVTNCPSCGHSKDGFDCPPPALNCLILDSPWTDPTNGETYDAISSCPKTPTSRYAASR